MPRYVISYDLRQQRNYEPLLKQLGEWQCARILESVWLGELKGPAGVIRNLLQPLIDTDDGLAVLPLADNADWATTRILPTGIEWLKARNP